MSNEGGLLPDEQLIARIPIDMSAKARPAPEGCKHNERTFCECRITYVEDLHRWTLEVQAHCEACGVRFRFESLPVAISVSQPCVNLSGYTVTLPIVPGDKQSNERTGP